MHAPVRLTALTTTLVAGSIAGVVVLADSAREHDGVSAAIDPHLAADVVEVRSGPLTVAAKLLTFVGSEAVIGVFALLLIIALLERRGALFAMCAAAAMAMSASLTLGVKQLVARHRPGPSIRLGTVDRTYSFPSGHSLNSAVFLGLVVILLLPLLRDRRRRIAVTCGLTLLAIGIGLSRLYLGYHWASDVIASWLLALAILALVGLASTIWGPAPVARAIRRRSGSRT
jgi:undecaprenyl-diphosphatase